MLKMWNPGPFVLQYLILLSVNISTICIGIGLSWASPVLVKLFDEENPPLGRPITQQEGSLIASVTFIGGLVGITTLAPISDVFGRKKALIIFSIPRILSYALLTLAIDVWMVVVARLVLGLSNGVSAAAIAIYSSEIASKEIRGGLGSMMQIFTSLGAVMMYSVGPFVSYFTLNLTVTCLAVVAIIPLLFLPDSPYFLYSKGQTEEAYKVLKFFRRTSTAAGEELKEYERAKEGKVESKSNLIREIFKSKVYLKSIGLVVCLNALTQLTGISAVTSYLQTVLISTESSVSAELSSVIIGLLQLTASVGTTFINDKIGRKPIILWCTVGMAVGFVFLGVFFNITSGADTIEGFLNLLPLLSLVLIVFSYNFGIGSLLYPIMAELLDGRIRAVGMSIAQLFGLVFMILNIYFFQSIQNAIGQAATFWIFSVTSGLLFIFIIFFIPETKGQSFAQIQENLRENIKNEA